MDEEENKIRKLIYFIPVFIQGLWIMFIDPTYRSFESEIGFHSCAQNDQIIEILCEMDLYIMILSILLSMIIGINLKKANCKINTGIRVITIIVRIILFIIGFFIPILEYTCM